MRAQVTIDRLDPPDKIIRLDIEQSNPRETFTVVRGDIEAGASGYLSAPEAYQLALDLLRAAAREGLKVRD